MKPREVVSPATPRVSHPAGVRGLKHAYHEDGTLVFTVAPRRGAWIETLNLGHIDGQLEVAPRRGAWIETG